MIFDAVWFEHQRDRHHHWRRDNLLQVLEDIRELEAEILAAIQGPHTITLTAAGGHMGTYAPGAPVKLTADVRNAEGAPVADTLSWSATPAVGTLTVSDDTLTATLTGAPLGDTTVTAVTSNGISASDTITVADQTPASIALTDAAA